ncbi:DsrH/TusB family sulfur relay protein [Haliea atlantica]|nr:sulfurtransferase complex subunit TusB [Haliea sp.]|tara:strand:+ start:82900 stop:83193 length:294 start_codon:yes stop_codon:yes gene_type:complete
MTLHTLNCPPGHRQSEACLEALAPGDALLLLGDGVYHALGDSDAAGRLAHLPCPVCLLEAEARAAGVLSRLANAARVIDEDGFVALTEEHPRQLAWY